MPGAIAAVTGGGAGIRFSLLSQSDGLALDERTGNLVVDNPATQTEAAAALEQFITKRNRGEPYLDTLRDENVKLIDRGTALLGKRPDGTSRTASRPSRRSRQ